MDMNKIKDLPLKELLKLDNELYKAISAAAVKWGKGTHPKHRVTNYHKFFTDRVTGMLSVLDLGSGRGDVTYDISKTTKGNVVGIEINPNNLKYARSTYKNKNLKFICGDITKNIPERHFDIVVMSNVLEHLPKRAKLLKGIVKTVTPDQILFRIPHFEREWMVPVKKELGVDYMLDRTHYIEYTHKEFEDEMHDAELTILEKVVNWGEIWAVCVPGVYIPQGEDK